MIRPSQSIAAALFFSLIALAAPAIAMQSDAAESQRSARELSIGAKSFTESAILGHLLTHLTQSANTPANLRTFPGSAVAFNALLAGEIDAYPEYTGTLKRELLAALNLQTDDQLRAALAERGLKMSAPIGFNNTYAVGLLRQTADRLNIQTISDLADHPDLRIAMSNEFMNRGDGWPALATHYNLPNSARGIEHALAYAALDANAIDATDLYSTDAQIEAMNLAVLEDDRSFFPRYDAVIIYRAQLESTHPSALKSMLRLEAAIDEPTMQRLNRLAEIGRAEGDAEPTRISPEIVAAEFATNNFAINARVTTTTLASRIFARALEHLTLVSISMAAAIMVAIPIGVAAARNRTLGGPILGLVGILQTIPAIALLVLLIGPFGIGAPTAIIALFLYSLLPIVRNTHAGLDAIPPDLTESAHALGLSPTTKLFRIDLPLALPTLLAGIKTAAVINVGTATLGGFISAGGFGQPIFTGITQNNFALILEGAIPAAALAVLIQIAFGLIEPLIVSDGLRTNATTSKNIPTQRAQS